jgi:hypothetical protein
MNKAAPPKFFEFLLDKIFLSTAASQCGIAIIPPIYLALGGVDSGRSTELSPNAMSPDVCRLCLARPDCSGILIARSVAFGSAECDDPRDQTGLWM